MQQALNVVKIECQNQSSYCVEKKKQEIFYFVGQKHLIAMLPAKDPHYKMNTPASLFNQIIKWALPQMFVGVVFFKWLNKNLFMTTLKK